MRVFITLPEATISLAQTKNQWLGRMLGRRAPHVVAATRPLPLWGEWVYSLQLTPDEVTLYGVSNPLGNTDVSLRYFVIPTSFDRREDRLFSHS
jgi:hypothetical protein